MPVLTTYPGVYIEEIPSGVRTITGVATSITAFVGRALRGPTDLATMVNSFGDFERTFGGLWLESALALRGARFFSQRRRASHHRALLQSVCRQFCDDVDRRSRLAGRLAWELGQSTSGTDRL